MQKSDSELHHLVRKSTISESSAPLLVLLHGYGSNEKDLFSLSDKIPDNWHVISLRAPIEISANQYKWYNVAMVNQEITLNIGDEEKSRKAILQLIANYRIKHNISKVVTAGFSQGANMAVGLVLTEPELISAAACFSGRFMKEIKPLITNKKALKNKSIFIGHGTQDNMLPISYAEENRKTLEEMGVNVTFTTDQIGHSISAKELSEFVSWLGKL